MQAPDIDRCVQKYIYEKTFSCASVIASVGSKVFHRQTYGTLIFPARGLCSYLRDLNGDGCDELLVSNGGTGLSANLPSSYVI